MLIPRYYQQESKECLYEYWKKQPQGSALLSLCTGSGKSVIIADITKDVIQKRDNTRVIILSHVSEILEQNYLKVLSLWKQAPIGLYSASLGKKQIGDRIIVAGIQSVHRKANVMGWFSLVIIDEAHLISEKDSGMYRKFIADLKRINPNIRILGLSATPWRTKGGLLTEGEKPLFDEIVYTYSMRQAIDDGFLSPLISKHSLIQADLSDVGTSMGEFNLGQMAIAFDNEYITQMALQEVIRYGHDRKAWLLFGSSVEHAYHLKSALIEKGIETACITGETPRMERDGILRMFESGERYRAITNNNVLTTGTDIPRIDLIAMLRATKSSGLLLQAVGRGVRLSPETGKSNCLLLDFGGNLERFGCIDQIEAPKQKKKSDQSMPMKVCPECQSVHAIAVTQCADCGYEFPIDTMYKHDAVATNAPAMSSEAEWYEVDEVAYRSHKGKVIIDGDNKITKPDSLKVRYLCGTRLFCEWICINHDGNAYRKARSWIEKRLIVDDSNLDEKYSIIGNFKISDAVDKVYELMEPVRINVRKNGKYEEIVGYEF